MKLPLAPDEVDALIDKEREYQEHRWPGHVHSRAAFVTLMWHYYRRIEASEASAHRHSVTAFEARSNLRKIAALAVALMERYGFYERAGDHRQAGSRFEIYNAIARERLWQENNAGSRAVIDELSRLRFYLGKADEFLALCVGCQEQSDVVLRQIRIIAAICVGLIRREGAPARADWDASRPAATPVEK